MVLGARPQKHKALLQHAWLGTKCCCSYSDLANGRERAFDAGASVAQACVTGNSNFTSLPVSFL